MTNWCKDWQYWFVCSNVTHLSGDVCQFRSCLCQNTQFRNQIHHNSLTRPVQFQGLLQMWERKAALFGWIWWTRHLRLAPQPTVYWSGYQNISVVEVPTMLKHLVYERDWGVATNHQSSIQDAPFFGLQTGTQLACLLMSRPPWRRHLWNLLLPLMEESSALSSAKYSW